MPEAWTTYTPAEAASLLWCLRECGFTVRLTSRTVLVAPADRLTDFDRLTITHAKPQLLDVLKEEEAAGLAALVEGFA